MYYKLLTFNDAETLDDTEKGSLHVARRCRLVTDIVLSILVQDQAELACNNLTRSSHPIATSIIFPTARHIPTYFRISHQPLQIMTALAFEIGIHGQFEFSATVKAFSSRLSP